MFEATCRHREVDRSLRLVLIHQCVNQSRAEAVATAHAVDNVHSVFFAKRRFTVRKKHTRPVVVGRRLAFAQSDRNPLKPEPFRQLLGYGDIPVAVELAARYVATFHLDPERVC